MVERLEALLDDACNGSAWLLFDAIFASKISATGAPQTKDSAIAKSLTIVLPPAASGVTKALSRF